MSDDLSRRLKDKVADIQKHLDADIARALAEAHEAGMNLAVSALTSSPSGSEVGVYFLQIPPGSKPPAGREWTVYLTGEHPLPPDVPAAS